MMSRSDLVDISLIFDNHARWIGTLAAKVRADEGVDTNRRWVWALSCHFLSVKRSVEYSQHVMSSGFLNHFSSFGYVLLSFY